MDEAELARTLEGLDALVGGRPGPYVLTDLRFREGPLYVRYGGFRTRYMEDADGELVTAFRRPDGTPEPDRRAPVFHTPDWVATPDILKDSLAARQAVDDFPYRITGALHFSHGGGVYRAEAVATTPSAPGSAASSSRRAYRTRVRTASAATRSPGSPMSTGSWRSWPDCPASPAPSAPSRSATTCSWSWRRSRGRTSSPGWPGSIR